MNYINYIHGNYISFVFSLYHPPSLSFSFSFSLSHNFDAFSSFFSVSLRVWLFVHSMNSNSVHRCRLLFLVDAKQTNIRKHVEKRRAKVRISTANLLKFHERLKGGNYERKLDFNFNGGFIWFSLKIKNGKKTQNPFEPFHRLWLSAVPRYVLFSLFFHFAHFTSNRHKIIIPCTQSFCLLNLIKEKQTHTFTQIHWPSVSFFTALSTNYDWFEETFFSFLKRCHCYWDMNIVPVYIWRHCGWLSVTASFKSWA